ncbi:MAG TPA: hypothetical protein VK986_11200, partial [Tepidisphaeraceae bacterium]|nr:hypothetical protein [Tepidisphaeraceae bacterium]
LGLQALGYIGGVFYSLAYLRKVAIPTNPLGCIIPSNVTFLVLVALALGWNIKHFDLFDHLGYLAALVVYYAVITAVFAIVTRNGFRQMAGFVGPRGFEVQSAVPVMPVTPPPPTYEDPAGRR